MGSRLLIILRCCFCTGLNLVAISVHIMFDFAIGVGHGMSAMEVGRFIGIVDV